MLEKLTSLHQQNLMVTHEKNHKQVWARQI